MKLSQLPTNTNLSADDLIYCVDDAAGTPQSRKATIASVLGLSYAGTNTWTGLQTFTATNATTRGLVVKGAASQTANLQEWQNNSGTALARVDSSGRVFSNNGSESCSLFHDGTNARLTSSTSNVLITETNNLCGLTLAYSGSAYSQINMGGYFIKCGVGGNVLNNGDGTFVTGGPFHVTAASASTIPVTVRGAASQTANLQEWQNSSGNRLSYIRPNGAFQSGENGVEGPGFVAWNNGNAPCYTASGNWPTVMSVFRFGGNSMDIRSIDTVPSGSGMGIDMWWQNHFTINSAGTHFGFSSRPVGPGVVVITHTGAGHWQTGVPIDYLNCRTSAGVTTARISTGGYFITAKTVAPPDAELSAGEAAYWLDSTNGAAKFMVKAKQANGTVVTGSVALT